MLLPAVFPHHVSADPLLRHLLLFKEQIKPFQDPLHIPVFEMFLLPPFDAVCRHMIPTANIQPAVFPCLLV